MSNPAYPSTEFLTFLKSTQMFQDLSWEQITAVAKIAHTQSYQKGEIIFYQGEQAAGFYLVCNGKVKVFQESSRGREQILHIFGVGEHFAEVPMFDGKCFPASAIALDNTKVLLFPRQLFFQLLQQNPTLTINLLKSLARHLRRFSFLVDSLSLKAVPGRLAIYLLQLREQQGHNQEIELDITKGQLAALLGTIPETLSRVLYKLTQENILEIDGSKITILDLQSLEKLAN